MLKSTRSRIQHYRDLDAWQLAMKIVVEIYRVTRAFPTEERFGLVAQLRRAAVSIPSNIAEGSGKRTNNHFAEFLTTSLTSAYELETQLLICHRRNYGDEVQISKLLGGINSLQGKIFNFREKIINN